ncbi:sacsin N-terminal ATP-binding-like domain-containing protein [Proteiniclasticum sp.]|uniref:sacsin N-terminal ATP-binding-like domain-containing protein n=1 Tax=Proteiniclasticum sp. TaxID=2053595 RepID=UPI00289F4E71|nr:hypothetical protein [Proteiniclasticum sp.]
MEFNIEFEKKRVLDEIRKSEPGSAALEKLRYVREKMDWAIEGYRNSLTILSDTTYEDRKHFLMELIQNADDADYGDRTPEIHFHVTDEGLEIYYNEIGFTVEDIISITDTGASTKKSKKSNSTSFIGEKGIGFKSVFALAETVEIHSGPWHFLLGKDQCIVPKAVDVQEVGCGTRQIIRFTDSHVTEEIYKELKRYISGEAETFIYLQKISKFVLVDKRKENYEKHEIEIIPADRSGDRLTLRMLNTGEEREFLLYSENIHFSEELVASRWEKIGTSLGSVDRKVVLAAAMSGTKVNDQGRLFCYLPTSVSLPLPVYMQVDGVTKADRERIHDPQNNLWNKHLLSELPDIIARAITHWSKVIDSPEIFQRLIPINDGSDQLYYVFFMARRALKNQAWVKTFGMDSKYQIADYVMGFPPYINELFSEFPELANGFDKHLKKYILHHDWYNNIDLRKKLGMCGVEFASDIKILSALRNIELPTDLTQKKEKLLGLYRFMIEILENRHSSIKNPGESFIKLKTDSIKELKIFPIENHGFRSLNSDKMTYYSLSEEGNLLSSNAMIIDPSYLRINKTAKDESETISEEEKLDIKLAETLLSLMKLLGISELSDEIVLSDFIIPELKSKWYIAPEKRIEKLISVFDYYSNKLQTSRTNKVLFSVFDNNRSKLQTARPSRKYLEGMEEIWLYGKDNNVYQLKELLIPDFLRISDVEEIYDQFGLEQISIPATHKNRIIEDKKLFHDFLVECGVRHKPVYHMIKEEYVDAADFRESDPHRFDIWRKRIKNDYTLGNRVTVERVVLDETDQKIIRKGVFSEGYEKYLYSVWLEHFQNNEINDYSYYYKGKAIPGYFLVIYKRNERRCIQLKDLDWAGVEKKDVPLKLFNGDISHSSNAFILLNHIDRRLQYLYEFLRGVVREDVYYPHLSYSSLYLETLEIRDLNYRDLEVLWNKVSENRFGDIIDFVSLMISSNVSYDEIRILNKNTGRLTDLKKFKLGQISIDDDPLIEEQYGESGKKLGEISGLAKGGTIESYIGTITSLLTETELGEATIKRMINLLQEWNTYKADEKMLIIDEFRVEIKAEKPPILILGEPELYQNFLNSNVRCVLIPEDFIKTDKSILYRAAGEIGFILPDSFGKLEIVGSAVISRSLLEKCKTILNSYVNLIEAMEIDRLDDKLKIFGGIKTVLTHVILGFSAYREETGSGVSYVVKLPYKDPDTNRIVIENTLSEYKIIREILLMVEFAPKRNVDQDLSEIRKSQERQQRTQESIAKAEAGQRNSTPDLETHHTDIVDLNEAADPNEIIQDRVEKKDFEKVEVNVSQNVDAVVSILKDKLSGSTALRNESEMTSWKLGPDPEEELEIREALIENIAHSLNQGPEVYKKKLRDVIKTKKMYKGTELAIDESLIDKGGIDPRAFLEAEYDCRCQVCGKQIVFDSGKKWISVYHIQEKKEGAWFYDRPFNILGLCPNCYTMAKYSGNRDFSQLLSVAQDVVEGEAFAESVSSFGGDYYLVDVVLDNKNYQMKLSKVHMNYFAALVELEDKSEYTIEMH